MQSKKESLVEAFVNVFIGYWINFTANLIILPLFGFDISLKTNLIIGLIYTVISVARSYVIRRFFNSYLHLLVKWISEKF